ncbi:MAG: gamma-glutamyl-gamma-aminobutyrate hydrolase family protein [Anaerolineales bacterium]|nr:gamma-glutamyl-gamma-aminobutyrate hydrolase family protein [Anaerolineales bacterium]
MPIPWIGITCGRKSIQGAHEPWFGLPAAYSRAIISAGGLPLIIPPEIGVPDLHILFDRLDGLVFSGGGDVHPRFYGQRQEVGLRAVDEQRDQMEIDLVRLAVETAKPFLAICRGIQVLNVALGGSLYQDLTEQLAHSLNHDNREKPRDTLAHTVTLIEGSRLQQWIDQVQIETNSLHHQAIRDLAPDLRIIAQTSDGVIEGIEVARHPFGFGVQWHPEQLRARPETMAIFSALMRASSE